MRWEFVSAQRWLLPFVAAMCLAACGGGGESGSSATANVAAGTSAGSGTSGGTGSATLSWTAPQENTDGSTLTDLAGYHIYYGSDASSLTEMITVTNRTTVYVVDNLGAGTYYFAIKAYNSAGVESDLSNVASKTIG